MQDSQSNTATMIGYRKLIFNSYQPPILAALSEVSVDETYLNDGKVLFEEVVALDDVRHVEVGEETKSSVAWREAFEVFVVEYRKTRKLVKVFAEQMEGLPKRLHVQGSIPSRQIDLIRGAELMYKALLRETEFVATLGAKWLTPEELESRAAQAIELLDIQGNFVSEQGDSQEATRLRNEKFKELALYCRLLKAKAEAVLDDRPQLLEKLGLTVK